MTKFLSGTKVLQILTSNAAFPLRNQRTFNSWLLAQVKRTAEFDDALSARLQINKLRQQHWGKLAPLTKAKLNAKQILEASPSYQQIQLIQRNVEKLEKKLQCMQQFLITGDLKRLTEAKQKETKINIANTEELLQATRVDLDQKQKLCLELATFEKVELEKRLFETEIGINVLKIELEGKSKDGAHVRAASGDSFEKLSLRAVRESIVPKIREKYGLPEDMQLDLITNVMLKIACGELDIVIVHRKDGETPVRVFAVVECKANINDIGPSYGIHQQTLCFLTQHTTAYNTSDWANSAYRSGIFQFPAGQGVVHMEQHVAYKFDGSSFANLKDDRGRFLEGLYFVTREPAEQVSDIASRISHRLCMRFAQNLECSLEDGLVAQGLFEEVSKECQKLSKYTTTDVFRMYESNEELTHHVIVVSRKNGSLVREILGDEVEGGVGDRGGETGGVGVSASTVEISGV
eukprot:c27166_g1_i1.p1 GENE.c27166_g1_i1~~c27166_g1_i1.p1  ORF type:complete len:513 (-),score=134.49 c27166_g1_i1:46-1434(-)